MSKTRNPRIYYFGRGSSSCIGVRIQAGNYVSVFIGNGKAGEKGEALMIDRGELVRLSQFFRALWEAYGHEMYVSRHADDPHDEVFFHNLDFSQIEPA